MPRFRTRLAVVTVAGALLVPAGQLASATPPADLGAPVGSMPSATDPTDVPDVPLQPGAPPGLPADQWARLLAGVPNGAPQPRADDSSLGDLSALGQALAWQRCRSATLRWLGARCAMLTVPLDHADPTGPTIRLAVSRVRHTVAARNYRGVMLVNPGGPGAAGLEFAGIGRAFPRRLASAYDWIGFDPRGVGASRPALRCDPSYFGFDRPEYIPRRRADRDAWLNRSRGYASACAANGDILRHLRTEDVARDMEALRVALGVRRVSFYGFSYGTYLGQVYATLFPQRVRRMVLDSNVDPRDVFYRANLEQNIAIDRSLRLWLRWTADHHQTYRLGRTRRAVTRAFLRTRRNLERRPAAGRIGGSEWTDIFVPVVYSRDSWPQHAAIMSRYVRTGRAEPLVRAYRRVAGPQKDNGYAVYLAVQCTDAPWPSRWSTWAQDNWRSYDRAPLTTWLNAWFNMPCRFWPAPAGPRFAVAGRSLPPTLLVAGTLDGPTPFPNSLAVRRSTPAARLVAIRGEATHAASANGIRCVTRRVTAYLLEGRLPRRRPANRPDVVCPAPPAPTP